jgi:hypothetical protein
MGVVLLKEDKFVIPAGWYINRRTKKFIKDIEN